MAAWIVTLTDRSAVTVEVRDGLPDHVAAREAMVAIDAARLPDRRYAFSARPEHCTGFAYNVHNGAEQACPIHRTAAA